MTELERIQALEFLEGKIDVVLDTDAYNEIDDQFAIAYMLGCGEKLNVKAIFAAPFFNEKSTGPQDGMEKSYREIEKILSLCGRHDLYAHTYRGSGAYLSDEKTPVSSDAAARLVELSKQYSKENRLYVVAIGAITNIASALLIDREMIDRIVVVWLGGHAFEWHDTHEFNMFQDVAAARVVLQSGVPLVLLPCKGVVSAFSVSAPELDRYLTGKNPLADYLAENAIRYMGGREVLWSKSIWDVTAVAWLLNKDGKFMRERIIHAPVPEYDFLYAFPQDTPLIKYVYHIERDALMEDLFEVLTKKFS